MSFRRRPIAILLISAAYVVSPFVNMVQDALVNGHDAAAVKALLVQAPTAVLFLLFSTPAVGVALYTGRRWSYFACLLHAAVVVIYATYAALIARSAHMLVLLATSVSLIGVCLYFIRFHPVIRVPYMYWDGRGWQLHERFECNVPVTVEHEDCVHKGTTLNISRGGALVLLQNGNLLRGDTVLVSLRLGLELALRLRAKVMRVDGCEIGVEFIGQTARERQALAHLIDAGLGGRSDDQGLVRRLRRSMRVPLSCDADVVLRDGTRVAHGVNVSRTGVLLEMDDADAALGDQAHIALRPSEHTRIGVTGIVRRIEQGHVAFEFVHPSDETSRQLTSLIKQQQQGGLAEQKHEAPEETPATPDTEPETENENQTAVSPQPDEERESEDAPCPEQRTETASKTETEDKNQTASRSQSDLHASGIHVALDATDALAGTKEPAKPKDDSAGPPV